MNAPSPLAAPPSPAGAIPTITRPRGGRRLLAFYGVRRPASHRPAAQ